MTYTEKEARALIIRAGHQLIEQGLAARTWGNISARISSTHFIITPSGLPYDTLQPEQLVRVRIADCAWEGSIKPSSEKGIHAAAYLHRPDAGFVIHTHQEYASCVSVSGKALTDLDHPILGECVPCAAYGMPSTKKLQRNMDTVMVKHHNCNAILMRSHGALCIGRDYKRAFELAHALEEVSRATFDAAITLPEMQPSDEQKLLDQLRAAAPRLHFTVESGGAAQAMAVHGKTLHPHLDDLAQIAGATIRCSKKDAASVMKALHGRNAVLIPGIGAVCCAEDESDLEAIAAIARKGCLAALYAEKCSAAPLGRIDRAIMRLVYTKKYSKKKNEA